jgi:putative acetyltransferase
MLRPKAQPTMHVQVDDPARPDVCALLEEHLREMYELSPPESVHALDVSRLKSDDITFWSVRDGDQLLGCGALKQLSPAHGEIKSMRTPAARRGRGAGRAVLLHIVAEAQRRGYVRLSLETGTAGSFAAAHRLYESVGFVPCGPFGDYLPDPHSVFMTLDLTRLVK